MLWHTAKQTLSFLGNLSHIFMVSVTSLQAWRLKNRTANLLAGSVFLRASPVFCLISNVGTSAAISYIHSK